MPLVAISRETDVYDSINGFYAKNGWYPSAAELMDSGLDLGHTQIAFYFIKLAKSGLIQRNKKGRVIATKLFPLPSYGKVIANKRRK